MTKFIELTLDLEDGEETEILVIIDSISTIEQRYQPSCETTIPYGCEIAFKSKIDKINVQEDLNEIKALICQAEKENSYRTK